MAQSSKKEVLFLPVVTNQPLARRDVELSRSSARSHLAKRMHRQIRERDKSDKILANRSKRRDTADIEPLRTQELLQLRLPEHTITLCTSLPDKTLDHHTTMLLHHCATCFFPGFGIGSEAFHVPPFVLSYNDLIAQGPALVHAVLWQAAVNLNYRRGSQVTDKSSLRHYQKAISCISQEMERPIQQIGEETLYAILSLTGPEISAEQPKRASPRKVWDPPLATLAWIHVFGRQPLEEPHATALCRLVDLKGGIDALFTPGFFSDVNYMDILRSSHAISRPHYPIARLYWDILGQHSRENFFGYEMDLPKDILKSSPVQSSRLAALGLAEDLYEAILDMRAWVHVVERHHVQRLSNSDPTILSAHRDLIQHRLLSTLPANGMSDIACEDYEITTVLGPPFCFINTLVQVAAFIFSLGVTFPIIYEEPQLIAGQCLRTLTERNLANLLALGLHDLVIWSSTVGALAGLQLGDGVLEARFIDFMSEAESSAAADAGRSGCRSWNEVKESALTPFLWSGVACDAAAAMVWDEVRRLSGNNTLF